MPAGSTHPKIDAFMKKARSWTAEMAKLREIALSCGLTESRKWGKPCYSFNGANIVIIAPFAHTCAYIFFKGVLLKDPRDILIQPGEHSQSARQARFTSLQEIIAAESTLRAYLKEAIAAEKAGLKVTYKKPGDFKIPAELKEKFATNQALQLAFQSLTPGRQRAYVIFFTGAKQAATRRARIEKCIPLILAGKGLHDDYAAKKKAA